jgi:nitroreductase
MDLKEAIRQRHSVRHYESRPIEADTAARLKEIIDAVNKESGLHIQLVLNEPRAVDSFRAHYGKLTGITNYIALVGKKDSSLREKCGYYGQKIVLEAQTLGLNTCWIGIMFKKIPEAFTVNEGEKLALVIAVGYGSDQGHERKSKTPSEVSNLSGDSPEWFRNGVEAALLAPTATNQQKFVLNLVDGKVEAKALYGPFSKVDLGIVKFNFETGADKDSSIWA